MTAGIRTVIVPVKEPITDVGGGKLIATVKDADGNVVGLVQSP